MKTKALIIAAAIAVSSCHSVKQIGELNMISTRNVSMKENYTLIKSYAGAGKKELRKNKGTTVDIAINNLVRAVPGGEFVMNVKLYVVDHKYYAADGDIYGLDEGRNYKGFKVGDHVMWRDNFIKHYGIITDLKNDKECAVKDGDKIRIVRYAEMTKSE